MGRVFAKLALCGTHSTGKTTALYQFCLNMKLEDFHVEDVKEVARTSPLPLNENATPDSQTWILATQVAKEIEAQHKFDYVICDRSVLDTLAYYNLALKEADNPYPSIERFVFDWLKTYDMLIVMEPNVPLKPDGVRSENETYRKDVHVEFMRLLDKAGGEMELPLIYQIKASEIFDDFLMGRIMRDLVNCRRDKLNV